MNENDENILEDDFEYNDGIGDLLKEKEVYQFSWVKTAIVVLSLLMIIGGSVVLVSRIVQAVVVPTSEEEFSLNYETHQVADEANIENSEEQSQRENSLNVAKIIQQIKTVNQDKKEVEAKAPVLNQGLVETEAEIVKPKEDALVSKAKNALYRVIIGSYNESAAAKNMVGVLRQKNIRAYVWTYRNGNDISYRVQVGAFRSLNSAEQYVSSLKKQGYTPFTVYK